MADIKCPLEKRTARTHGLVGLDLWADPGRHNDIIFQIVSEWPSWEKDASVHLGTCLCSRWSICLEHCALPLSLPGNILGRLLGSAQRSHVAWYLPASQAELLLPCSSGPTVWPCTWPQTQKSGVCAVSMPGLRARTQTPALPGLFYGQICAWSSGIGVTSSKQQKNH